MRIIGHLDMDAFFASIEERDNSRFTGKPVVVGSDPKDGAGRGVVSTANYKAREYGIRSALPISTAWRYSEAARKKGLPPAVFVAVNMKKYGEVSRRVMEILRRHSAVIEEASVDEAYFDLSSFGSYEKAEVEAREIKKEIQSRERLTASIGIGPNKLVAKIASDRQKPDGLTVVRGEKEAESFLAPLSLRAIPGVGPKTEEQFKKLGAQTVGDAKKFSEAELYAMLGKWGPELYEKLRGRDAAPLVEEWEVKSIGEQETFEVDERDPGALCERMRTIAVSVYERFARSDFKSFKSITITVRLSDFTTRTRSTTLPSPSDARAVIEFEALRLFLPFLDARENPQKKAFRLLGVRVEKLASVRPTPKLL